ncbi:hypothetical protein PPACK8108_LOCUS21917, partial [Phakopsora pachyrhizi]
SIWNPIDSDSFDLNRCFKRFIYLIPIIIIIIGGSIELPRLIIRSRNQSFDNPPKNLIRSKLRINSKYQLIILSILTQISLIITDLINQQPWSTGGSLDHLTIVIDLLTLISLTVILPINSISHRISDRSSTTLLFFYLSFLLASSLELRSQLSDLLTDNHSVSNHQSSTQLSLWLNFSLFTIRSLLLLSLFSIECLGPFVSPTPYRPIPSDDQNLVDGSDHDDRLREDCPIVYSNIFSRLTFSWMTPMMKLGKQQYLTEADMWKLPSEETTSYLTFRLNQQWTRQLLSSASSPGHSHSHSHSHRSPSLIRAVFGAYGLSYAVAALFKILQDILQFVQPQLLKRLLQFVDSRSGLSASEPEPAHHGYLIAIVMFVCSLVQTIILHQYFQRVFVTGIRVRSGLIGVIYEKSLVLSNEEKTGRATGDIVNLMSTDVSRIQDSCSNGLILFSGVFQIALAFISLYYLLGWSMLAGILVVLLAIPLNTGIARLMTRLQRQLMKNQDQRTRLMNEILNNIRSVKLYCWENAFTQKLMAVRNNHELVLLKKIGFLQSFGISLWNFVPFLVAFSAFTVYSITSPTPLTPSVVFPAISLFQLLQFPLAILPMVINQWVEAFVSIGRIHKFLMSKELQEGAVVRKDLQTGEEYEEFVSVKDGEFSWNSTTNEPTLSKINLSVRKSNLVAVVGRVGSGKSSLLSAILGEMYKISGRVELRGRVAYAAQTPWLLSATVRENILFGHSFDEELYKNVIEACALLDDLAMLKDGDETQVGEKGISLSGGQKARISLARAVYARADVYLLDDPMSSVDAHVARHLFERVIGPRGLLRGKTRVLCTNAIPFCEEADELVMLRDGKVVERGSFEKVLKENGELKKLIDDFGSKAGQAKEDDREDEDDESGKTVAGTDTQPSTSSSSSLALKKRKGSDRFMRGPLVVDSKVSKSGGFTSSKPSTKPKEHRSTGSVKKEVYKKYIKACGLFGISIYLSTMALMQVIILATTLWLKVWSTSNQKGSNDRHSLFYYLSVYGALGFLASSFTLINGFTLFGLCIVRSARKLHDGMFHRVLRAPMSFFDTTPVGVILNRFSRDVSVIDTVLARVFSGVFRTAAQVISVIGVVVWGVPPILVILIPLLFVYKRIQSYYLATSRELKRIDAVTKSPIFAMFGETLNGVATIRAFGEQSRFIGENQLRVDRNQEAYYASIGANRWLAVRLELIGNSLILTAAFLSVISVVTKSGLDSGLVGVLMSYAFSITQSLNWLLRSITEVETNIVSCERVIEYTDLKQEGPFETNESSLPPPEWPDKGEIEFNNVECKYREELDLVLKGVSFKTKACEKVGICGRTGAGKSTITLSLFRVIEKSKGEIKIDGVEIKDIGLHTLRSRVSIIPQDPQCFEGSLRENLDPEGNRTDDELWRVLEQSRLKSHIQGLEGGLDAKIEEGGGNLSNGQRQLLCLSRALLKRSKVIVMDEATSSIDPETDQDIQTVVREEFKDCSILIIAHRLNTILDCDRILVLSDGKVVEFDTPSNLLTLEKGEEEKGSEEGTVDKDGDGDGKKGVESAGDNNGNMKRTRFYYMCKEAGLVQ